MRGQFVLSEIFTGLRRNLTMTFAVIVSVGISLALLGSSLLANQQVSAMKGYWYDKVQVAIYLCNKNDAENDPQHCDRGAVTGQQKREIEADLKKLDVVEKVYYEPKDEAFKHYQEQFKDSPLASSLTPDQMQESFRVKLEDPTKYDVIASAFGGRAGVQEVQDQRALLEPLFGLLDGMNKAALFVMALMLVVAMLLIVNTVRVSAFSRRRETGIMRLVGASSFYIQMPFILEAAIAGLIGAALACGMLLLGKYALIDQFLAEQIQVVNFVGYDAVLQQLPWVVGVGLLMPSLAAFLTLRKYLNV
ncbi:permease-like cell division protein FtsX [Streptomyces chumphonensis]|uniref:Cell division protein FtsX n=1 Tax=Streptomyces chumphonensis TaxID=1214925 RepID=A0A927EY90_9ACTN|nr:permease-like cell division protein FtsX [Streptomyces chumphonensis]MBD3930951.1 ABC transporter permease [Streptomyces chumphonensis]